MNQGLYLKLTSLEKGTAEENEKIDAFSITIGIYLADESVNIIGYYKKKWELGVCVFIF